MPPGTVHVLLSEPMNAQELFTYHFASGQDRALFICTDVEESEVQSGIQRVSPQSESVKVRRLKSSEEIPPPPNGARFVLDSFSSYSHNIGWDTAMKSLHKLKAAMRQSGQVALMTIVQGLQEPHELARLKLWADGVLELGFDRQGFGLYPFLKVTKMRGVPDSARFLLFKETEKGLFMESTRRVF